MPRKCYMHKWLGPTNALRLFGKNMVLTLRSGEQTKPCKTRRTNSGRKHPRSIEAYPTIVDHDPDFGACFGPSLVECPPELVELNPSSVELSPPCQYCVANTPECVGVGPILFWPN